MQLGRWLDLVANIVVDLLEDDQRGLARRQGEALAELADPDLVGSRLAFERRQRQARPLHRGQARRVLARLHRDDAGRDGAGGVADADRQLGTRFRQDAGDDESSRRRALRLHHDLLRAERADGGDLAAVTQQRIGRRLTGLGDQVDGASVAGVGERPQRGRVAAGGAVDREHRHREREPPWRAIGRQAVAEPERLGRDAVVAHCAQVAGAVVDRALEGAPECAPVAAANLEGKRRRRGVGDADQVDAGVAHRGEVGVEQRQLAIGLALCR